MEIDATKKIGAFLYVRGLVNEDLSQSEIMHRSSKLIACLNRLVNDLSVASDDDSEENIQSIYYEAGKLHFASELRWWFSVLYQILLRQQDGPRLGQFTKIMTLYWVIDRINDTINDPWGRKSILT